MSKIEEALKKARAMQPAPSQGAPLGPDLPAVIPASEEIARMAEPFIRSSAELAAWRIIHPRMRDRRVLNAFRDLRTTLTQKSAGKNAVVLVTSTAPRGGSSFTAINLAASIAFDENRTAVVLDCNLRRPAHQRLVAETGTGGLTDYLLDTDVPVADIIYPTGIPRLRLLPAGTRHSEQVEYFTFLKMRQLLQELKHRYRERYVIIDAPSASESADVRMLAEACDLVLVVVPYGRSTDQEVDATLRVVDEQKLLGVLINNEPPSPLWVN